MGTKGKHAYENDVPGHRRRSVEFEGCTIDVNSQEVGSVQDRKNIAVPLPKTFPNEFTFKSTTAGKK